MKVTMEFNLPEERDEHMMALLGPRFLSAIEEIEQEIFRPPMKHGFSDKDLQELYDKSPHVRKYHELISKMFYEIISDIREL